MDLAVAGGDVEFLQLLDVHLLVLAFLAACAVTSRLRRVARVDCNVPLVLFRPTGLDDIELGVVDEQLHFHPVLLGR